MADVETTVTPPEVGEDGGGGGASARVSVYFSDVDDRSYDAGVQLHDVEATDPDAFADAAVRVVLAVAHLRGPEFSWALMQALTRYDGMPSWQGREPGPVPYAQHEREMLQLVGERDRLEDIADRLAAAIAPPEVLGEHSSDNNPWRNALDYADTATQRRDAAAPSPTPPTGQQQGREVCCGHDEHNKVFGFCRTKGCLCVLDLPAPSSAPPARDSGRDEAREAVAAELARHQGLRGPMDDDRPDVWQNRCECGWDDGDETPGWRVRYRLHVADAVVHLLAVSQPLDGAAPTTCHHLLGEHSRVPGVGCLVYLAPAVDGDPLTLCPCTHPGTSDADQ